uniref:Uncharacterized protein n=1 Tax=Cacopsylla melanoneura TaxID=428564 RepID=A0A8D8QSZ7_9HEMI
MGANVKNVVTLVAQKAHHRERWSNTVWQLNVVSVKVKFRWKNVWNDLQRMKTTCTRNRNRLIPVYAMSARRNYPELKMRTFKNEGNPKSAVNVKIVPQA